MDDRLSNTIIGEFNSQQGDTITNTILIDELGIEIQHQAVALVVGGISFHLKTEDIIWLNSTEDHRTGITPDISRITSS